MLTITNVTKNKIEMFSKINGGYGLVKAVYKNDELTYSVYTAVEKDRKEEYFLMHPVIVKKISGNINECLLSLNEKLERSSSSRETGRVNMIHVNWNGVNDAIVCISIVGGFNVGESYLSSVRWNPVLTGYYDLDSDEYDEYGEDMCRAYLAGSDNEDHYIQLRPINA